MVKKSTKKIKKISIKQRWLSKKAALFFAIIFAFVGAYFIFQASAAPKSRSAVTLFLSPSSQRIPLSQNFTVSVRLNTNGEAANAVQAVLSYPSDKLEFVSINASASPFEVQAVSTGGNGAVEIARGSFVPITSSDVLVGDITFRPIAAGRRTNISFTSGSAVARYSDNTDILAKTIGGQFTIY